MDAKKIVEKLGQYSEEDESGRITIPLLNVVYSHTLVSKKDGVKIYKLPTEKQTRVHAAEVLQQELDDGNIVLSDTWAEDNLS